MLDVAPGLISTWKLERSTAQESYALGFAFAEAPRRDLAIALLAFGRMAEEHMRQLMDSGLVRQGIQRIDGDTTLTGPEPSVRGSSFLTDQTDPATQDFRTPNPPSCLSLLDVEAKV